jgi:HK97 gp10 family phage protein
MIKVELLGFKELEEALAQLPKATGKAVLRRALIKAAKPVEVEAQSLAPRGPTGNLKDSITISTRLKKSQRRGPKPTGVEIYIGAASGKGKKGWHAGFVEFGTRKTAPRPFLRPAWDANKDKVLASIKTEIWAALAKAARTLARKSQRGTLSKTARRALGGD